MTKLAGVYTVGQGFRRLSCVLGLNPELKEYLGLTFLQKKLYSQAIDVFTKIPTKIPERGLLLSYAYAITGDKTRARTELDKNLSEKSNSFPFWLAIAYIGLGNFNEALTQL